MSPLSREAIFTVLSSLSVLACDKATPAAAEPTKAQAAVADSAAPAVGAKEVPSAAGSAEKEKSCAPGGCAPGQCGGAKKK
jgi:hypothetical protein